MPSIQAFLIPILASLQPLGGPLFENLKPAPIIYHVFHACYFLEFLLFVFLFFYYVKEEKLFDMSD